MSWFKIGEYKMNQVDMLKKLMETMKPSDAIANLVARFPNLNSDDLCDILFMAEVSIRKSMMVIV